jgi:biotin transport system ATP-binding protein
MRPFFSRSAPSDPAADPQAGIVLEEVRVAREGRPVLDGVTLSLAERRIGIVGLNGSGKSTLLNLIDGLEAPDSGRLTVAGLDTVRQGRDVRRRVGYLFQDPDNQIVMPVVMDDLLFGLKAQGLAPDEARRRADATLADLGILPLAQRRVHELSGGERQLVALAAVLAMEPATILFDEPTALLDLRNRNRLRDILRALPQQILVVTHDLDLLLGFDRVVVLHEGRVAADGPPETSLRFYRDGMG